MTASDRPSAEFSLGINDLKTPVAVDNGRRLGWRISEPGATLNLGPLFAQGQELLGEGLGYELYVKTGGRENIYHVGYNQKTGQWEIEGRNQSTEAEKRTITLLNPQDVSRLGILPVTIGTRLKNFGGWDTTEVAEIVLMERGFRQPENLSNLTGGRSSNIVDNFRGPLRALSYPSG